MEVVEGDVRRQTEQTIENIQSILKEGAATLDDVVKVTVYLDTMDDYDAMNEASGSYFESDPPARVCIEAARLLGDIDIEIVSHRARRVDYPSREASDSGYTEG